MSSATLAQAFADHPQHLRRGRAIGCSRWILLLGAAVAVMHAAGATAWAEDDAGAEQAAAAIAAEAAAVTTGATTDPNPMPAAVSATELPKYSRAWEEAQRRLPKRFTAFDTESFVLFSDGEASRIQRHALWMERTLEEFHRFANTCDLQPRPLRHKLVGILFDHRPHYHAFARGEDGVTSQSITGYYSPKNDRVVFALEPERREREALLASRGTDGTLVRDKTVLGFAEGQDALPATSEAAHACGHEHGDSESAAKCVHETIHQLMFHTGLMSPQVQYPLWICEGLSTAFETHDPLKAFGPDVDFSPRMDVFNALRRDERLLSLRELVTMTRLPSGNPDTVKTLYNQSYALVTWMARQRQGELREYLRLMSREPAGRVSAARLVDLFEQSFGEIETVERQWLAWEDSR